MVSTLSVFYFGGGDRPRGGHLLIFFKTILLVALTITYPYISSFYLQVEGNGNCLFSAVKRSLGVQNKNHPDHPYYPMRYFCCQVVVWLVQN